MNLVELTRKIEALAVGERLILPGLDEAIYHSAPGIGSSLMRSATQSMAHYKLRKDEKNERTREMIIGSAIHCLVLEPDYFLERFAVQPERLKAGNNGPYIAWKSEQTTPILTRSMLAIAMAAAESVMDRASTYFMDGEPEKSYWLRDASGLILKARIDYEIGDLGIDLKSTGDKDKFKFAKTVRYDYAVQDALYRRVTGLSELIFIGVGKDAPYPLFGAKQPSAQRGIADALISKTIEKIQIAEEFDDYPLDPLEIIETV